MLVYQDKITGDELLSDSFNVEEIQNGILLEVEGRWVVQGALDVDIGANPSAEGGDEGEGVDDQAVKVVDVIDTFRLQEQPAFDKKAFTGYLKTFLQRTAASLPADEAEKFKKDSPAAVKWLLGKLADLQFFVGESMNMEGGMVFAYYKEGAANPTFLYFKHGLNEVKC